MSEERKKVVSSIIPAAIPKKRVNSVKPILIEETQEARIKIKLDDKYVRIALNDTAANFKIIGDRVQKGELGVPYYTIENDKGILYYIIKKTE